MNPHKRQCWDCGSVAMHEDNIRPHVLCKKCGSQDTRKIKEQPPTDRQVVFESERGKVYAPDEQGNMATIGAGHSLCCDLAREILRLRKELRNVLDGNWSPTGIQEVLGVLNGVEQ